MRAAPAILILLLLTLSACGYFRKSDDNFKKCPTVGMIGDAQGWSDPPSDTEWKARAQVNEYDTKCKISKTSVTIEITPKVEAERSGELTDSLKQELPFFVASMRGDEIAEKKTEIKTIAFGSRERMAKDDYTLSIELPFNAEGTAADRNVLFGFQLTEAQLNYIRGLRDGRAQAIKPAAPAPATR